SGHDWVKAHAICGVKTNIVTAVRIESRDAGDSPQFKPLVETTAENFAIREVPADKAYLSHENLELVAGMGGTAFIPFKVNSTPGETGGIWEKMFGYFQFRRDEFLAPTITSVQMPKAHSAWSRPSSGTTFAAGRMWP